MKKKKLFKTFRGRSNRIWWQIRQMKRIEQNPLKFWGSGRNQGKPQDYNWFQNVLGKKGGQKQTSGYNISIRDAMSIVTRWLWTTLLWRVYVNPESSTYREKFSFFSFLLSFIAPVWEADVSWPFCGNHFTIYINQNHHAVFSKLTH